MIRYLDVLDKEAFNVRQDWKHTLYLYVDQYNRSELADKRHVVQVPIEDIEHMLKLSNRARRLKLLYSERKIVPVKSQIKTKIIHKHEMDKKVIIDVQFHIKRLYTQQGKSIFDERIDTEQLTLQAIGGDWVITHVQMPIFERHHHQLNQARKSYHKCLTPKPSPLLNHHVFNHNMRIHRTSTYHRPKAIQYAEQWWYEPNSQFISFKDNCTNYISQCLLAGGAPIHYTGIRDTGWWYKGMVNDEEEWSYSWAVANSLEQLLANSVSGLRGEVVEYATDLQLGDIIAYDWNGNGRYQHTAIVTAFDFYGIPLVNANTASSRHRYWDYRDSYAWTEATKYHLFHIPDFF